MRGRPAAIVTFLAACGCAGRMPPIAAASARRWRSCIWPAADFPLTRRNALSVAGWRPLFEQAARARRRACSRGCATIIERELDHLESAWPRDLPQGVIHADLFPDNVFFLGDRLSGLIDFYFACTDALAYDVAVCLNAWCFEPEQPSTSPRARALLAGYERVRPLSEAERAALPVLARGAAHALLPDPAGTTGSTPPGALVQAEGPAGICAQAALPPAACKRAATTAFEPRHERRKPPHVVIYTDGACSGNPGPGGWGAILISGDTRRS